MNINYDKRLKRSKEDIRPPRLKFLFQRKGMSIKQIADYFNCTKSIIRNKIEDFNLDIMHIGRINKMLSKSTVTLHISKVSQKESYNDNLQKLKINCLCGASYYRSLTIIKRNIEYHDGYYCCPKISPLGEYLIKRFLDRNNFYYEREYALEGLRDKNPLLFDFAIHFNNNLLLIEHDGKYHNNSTRKTKLHDKMKDNYCKEKGIPLLRIDNYMNISKQIESFIGNQLYMTYISSYGFLLQQKSHPPSAIAGYSGVAVYY